MQSERLNRVSFGCHPHFAVDGQRLPIMLSPR